jgi:hypothetical protein
MSNLHLIVRPHWRTLSLGLCLLASAALAQGPPNVAELKVQAQKQQQANEEALRHYTWKSRTEVRVGGEVKSILLEMVRYDASGNVQKTPIGGQAARKRSRLVDKTPIGALVKHVKEKKTNEYNEDLRKLVDAYAHIPPDAMQKFFQHAAFQPGQNEMQGTVRVFGSDVVGEHDTLSLWIDPQTREKRKVEILTSLHGDPVQIVSLFGKLADGVSYTSVSTVQIQAKQLQINTENFEFVRSGTP